MGQLETPHQNDVQPQNASLAARTATHRHARRLLVAAAIAALSLVLAYQSVDAATITVGPGGYPTIGQAVQASVPGDVIRIHAGTYGEQVTLNKSVTLDAFGDGPVWIDGGCVRQNGIKITGDGAIVTNLGIRLTAEAGIRIEAADNVVLNGLTIQDYNCADIADQYRAGIASWLGSTNLTIADSTITRRAQLAGPQTGYGNGIWVKNTSVDEGGGHYIAGNTIVGGYDGIGGEPEDALYGSYYRDTTIEQNTVTDCWDDGIQVEGGDINIWVTDNTIERCAIGIALAPNLQGPLYIQRNNILDLQPGDHGAVYAFKIGDGSTGTTFIEDNVVVTQGDGIKQSNPVVGPIVSRRNVIQVSRRVIEIQSLIPPGTSFDEDCVWSTDPIRFIEWESEIYLTLPEFVAGTGQEANGIESTDCAEIPTPTPVLPPDEDADGDGMTNGDEYACESDPLDAGSLPELIGGPFAGVDEDGDGQIDERRTYSGSADCDGDGFSAATENHVYDPSALGDQYPCGAAPSSYPFSSSPGWPADLNAVGFPQGTDFVNVLDLTSFLAPVRYLNTDVGEVQGSQRWDLVPGKGIFNTDINIHDVATLLVLEPEMLDSTRAFNGPACPWP